MLKKAVQQGRSERRGEVVLSSVREPLSEARTPHGKRRVLARRGRAGEKSDFFSILLIAPTSLLIHSTVKETAWKHGDAYSLTAL
jgi:hypothetical protein